MVLASQPTPVSVSLLAREHWFTFNDSSISVTEYPADPRFSREESLFFFHGRLSAGRCWLPLISELVSHYSCISVELPGFGLSYSIGRDGLPLKEHAELAVQIISRMSGKRAILIGHDTGCAISQLAAIKLPQVICGIVLLNPSSVCWSIPEFKLGWRGLFARRKLEKLLQVCKRLSPQMLELLRLPWSSGPTKKSILASMKALEETWPKPLERKIWQHMLKELACPTLLLRGEKDELTPPELTADLVKNIPDVHYFAHPFCGHWPYLEDSAWVASKLRDFLFKLASLERERLSVAQRSL